MVVALSTPSPGRVWMKNAKIPWIDTAVKQRYQITYKTPLSWRTNSHINSIEWSWPPSMNADSQRYLQNRFSVSPEVTVCVRYAFVRSNWQKMVNDSSHITAQVGANDMIDWFQKRTIVNNISSRSK